MKFFCNAALQDVAKEVLFPRMQNSSLGIQGASRNTNLCITDQASLGLDCENINYGTSLAVLLPRTLDCLALFPFSSALRVRVASIIN